MELFYLDTDSRIMAVPMKLESDLEPGRPRALFRFDPPGDSDLTYDVRADGQGFIVNEAVAGTDPTPTVVINRDAELRESRGDE